MGHGTCKTNQNYFLRKLYFAANGAALCRPGAHGAAWRRLLVYGDGEQARRARYVELLNGVFRDSPVLPVDAIASKQQVTRMSSGMLSWLTNGSYLSTFARPPVQVQSVDYEPHILYSPKGHQGE